jgi:transposase
MSHKSKKAKKTKRKVSINQAWPLVNVDAAGVDLGSREHWVAVPEDRDEDPVRCFGTFTQDLASLADWLQACRITSVAMEATGVYWIPLFQLLESRGFRVLLVNARQIKNVSGRKSDVADCQWIQRLHTYGLVGGSFRPADPYCVVREYLRHRENLVAGRTTQTQLMQKALQQMNVSLNQVVSDINGQSGMAIIEAILQGERNPLKLASLAHARVKASPATIAKALVGNYRREHLFQLQSACKLYHNYEAQIADCDQEMTRELEQLPDRVDVALKPLPPRATPAKRGVPEILRANLYQKLGVDLTAVEGIGALVAMTVLTEVGPDLSAFPTEKHFTSWLGLCPDNRVSGGRVLSSHTRRVDNRLSHALRVSATTLEHSPHGLGAYFRRMKAKLGAAAGITATAHKLARLIYRMLKHGEAYVQEGLEVFEQKYLKRKLAGLKKSAADLGMQLVPVPAAA